MMLEDLAINEIIGTKSIFGCQFYTEKSGPVGLAIMKNFVLS